MNITNYTFDASAGTIEFDDYGSIELGLVAVIAGRGQLIFNFADPTRFGSVAGNVLTLDFDTSAFDDADELFIVYKDEDSSFDSVVRAETTPVPSPNLGLPVLSTDESGNYEALHSEDNLLKVKNFAAYAIVDSENMHENATAVGDGVSLPTQGYTTALIEIPEIDDAEVTFEVQVRTGDWYPIPAFNIYDGASSETTTETGLYVINCAGTSAIRARISGFNSGQVSVYGAVTPMPYGEVVGGATAAKQDEEIAILDAQTGQLTAIQQATGNIDAHTTHIDDQLDQLHDDLTGAATEAKQDDEITALSGLASQLTTLHNDLLAVDGHVDGLEGFVDGIETLITATNSALSTLNSSVDGLEGFTDGIETLLTSISGFTDGLEAALDTVNTNLTTIDGHVDGLEALIGTTNTTLANIDMIVTAMTTNVDGFYVVNMGGWDGSGIRSVSVDLNGDLQVDVLSSALPSGAASEEKQDDEIDRLDLVIDELRRGIRVGGEDVATTNPGVQQVSLAGVLGDAVDTTGDRLNVQARLSGPNPLGGENVVETDASGALAVGGGVVAGTTDYGNPIKMGGKYNATSPTLTDGQRGDIQLDQAARLIVALGSLIAGEDLTNNVQGITEVPVASATYSPSVSVNFGTATQVLVKAAAGNVYSLRVTNSSPYVRYFQLHNKATVPLFGEVPSRSFLVPAGTREQPSVVELDKNYFSPSWRLSTGVGWAWSPNPGSYDRGASAADHTVDLSYV